MVSVLGKKTILFQFWVHTLSLSCPNQQFSASEKRGQAELTALEGWMKTLWEQLQPRFRDPCPTCFSLWCDVRGQSPAPGKQELQSQNHCFKRVEFQVLVPFTPAAASQALRAACCVLEVTASGLMSFRETTQWVFAFPTPLVNSIVFWILQIRREH